MVLEKLRGLSMATDPETDGLPAYSLLLCRGGHAGLLG